MHEMSVTESILEIVLRHAQDAEAMKVTDIHLVLGDLSTIVDDSVQFYWDMLSEGTLAEGAQMHFQRVQAEIECLDCGCTYRPSDHQLECPECRSINLKITAGEEFFVEAIEVELDGDIAHEPAGEPE